MVGETMSERNLFDQPAIQNNGEPRYDEGGLRAPPGLSPMGKIWWWFHLVILLKLARLRFIAVLIAVGGVIAYWDTLRAHYDKWTRPTAEQAEAAANTEFWCPMHPTIVREKPDKCPICGMPLSKRKKGEGQGAAWPPGVTSRVTLSPYRVALAGIQTAEIGYEPLTKDLAAVGFVEFDERKLARISARVTGKSRIDKLYVNVTGQMVKQGEPLALVYSPDLVVTVQNLRDARRSGNQYLARASRERLQLWGIMENEIDQALHTSGGVTHLIIRSPIAGHVIKKYQVEGEYIEEGNRLYDIADLSTVWIEAQVYEDELAFLHEGMDVQATTKAFPASKPFKGKVSFVHPHLDASTRTLKVRFDMENPGHQLRPGMYATVKLQVPATDLMEVKQADEDWWHEKVAVDMALHSIFAPSRLGEAGIESLLLGAAQRAVLNERLVLAVPERAVIDTGSRKFVYRESEPEVFDGIEVQLGPRCGGFYPVLRGLKAGDRIATTGSFLIDAETRLTSGAASTYFGASGGPQTDRTSAATIRPSMSKDEEMQVQGALSKLAPSERSLAEAQVYCPIKQNVRLGKMGMPEVVILGGQKVLLCCNACIKKAKSDEKKTLETVARLKAEAQSGIRHASAGPAPTPAGGHEHGTKDAKIKANLALLGPDRPLAEAQGYCPVTDKQLGSMGKPIKIMVKGQPVFVCCDGCVDDVREDEAAALAKVEKFKAKVKAEKGARP
jgi:Cu(I)/Ag(I) efflux system membrane fusion protein